MPCGRLNILLFGTQRGGGGINGPASQSVSYCILELLAPSKNSDLAVTSLFKVASLRVLKSVIVPD